MGLASRAALLAGVGGITVGVACGDVAVFMTPYDHQPARMNIPPRHTTNKARARPDWEAITLGGLERGDFIFCRSSVKLYL
jgi:hypothetical protein